MMSLFTKSKTKIKESNERLSESLCSYGLILLGSIFFTALITDFFESSWNKILAVVFIIGVVLKKLDDLKDENRLLGIASKESLSDIDALEDRIDSLEKFIKNEIRGDVNF